MWTYESSPCKTFATNRINRIMKIPLLRRTCFISFYISVTLQWSNSVTGPSRLLVTDFLISRRAICTNAICLWLENFNIFVQAANKVPIIRCQSQLDVRIMWSHFLKQHSKIKKKILKKIWEIIKKICIQKYKNMIQTKLN